MGSYMRCVGVGDVPGFGAGGWAGKENTFTPVNDLWVTCDVRLPAFFISYLASTSDLDPIIATFGFSGGVGNSLLVRSTGGGTATFRIDGDVANAGTLVANTWYTVEYHVLRVPGPDTVTIQLYLDGVLIRTYATTNTVAYDAVDIGFSSLAVADADQQIDFDNVKIGTTQGGSDIMDADFESLQIVPPFDFTVDPGGVGVITTPPGTGVSIYIVTDVTPPTPVSTGALVILDDVDVTEFVVEGSVTKRLNGVGTASVKLNMRMAGSALLWGTDFPGAGSYLRVYFIVGTSTAPVLFHHGRVLNCETSADENQGYTVFNSSDPLELWAHRPVRDPGDIDPPPVGYGQPGNFSKPYLLEQFGDPADAAGNGAPRVVRAMFEGSERPGGVPTTAEGPLRMVANSYASGVVGHGNVKGAPKDWPMTMAEMASNLTSTGICDIVCTPIEMDNVGNYGQLDVYNGDYGDDLSTSVAFQYGLGAFNVRALRWNEDMTNLCNKLWYYLGPKCDDQHWPANIQGDDPAFNVDAVDAGAWGLANNYVQSDLVSNNGAFFVCFVDNLSTVDNEPGVGKQWSQFWTYWMTPPGGRLSPPASATNVTFGNANTLGVMIGSSRAFYDARMDIQIFDGVGGEGPCVEGNVINHDLWRWQWQNEAWLRAFPRNLVHITPTRDTGIGDFDIGDLVLVEATTEVKGGFSGVQRIYQYTISWDSAESVPAVSELQTSSDQEGFNA